MRIYYSNLSNLITKQWPKITVHGGKLRSPLQQTISFMMMMIVILTNMMTTTKSIALSEAARSSFYFVVVYFKVLYCLLGLIEFFLVLLWLSASLSLCTM